MGVQQHQLRPNFGRALLEMMGGAHGMPAFSSSQCGNPMMNPNGSLWNGNFAQHRNPGHPSLPVFVRALRHAGVKPEVVEWCKKKFSCPICQRKPKVQSQRPGRLQRAMSFNKVVGVDLSSTRSGS